MSTTQTSPGVIEQVLRAYLNMPGSDVQAVMGWDASNVSRVLSGQQGIPLAKLDALVDAIDYVLIEREYLDAVGKLCRVGAHCECARRGKGNCGMTLPGRRGD